MFHKNTSNSGKQKLLITVWSRTPSGNYANTKACSWNELQVFLYKKHSYKEMSLGNAKTLRKC